MGSCDDPMISPPFGIEFSPFRRQSRASGNWLSASRPALLVRLPQQIGPIALWTGKRCGGSVR
jgi:hypothetical protein